LVLLWTIAWARAETLSLMTERGVSLWDSYKFAIAAVSKTYGASGTSWPPSRAKQGNESTCD
jgi:predicted lipoprotein with Yx(FWY)xxD motif